MSLFVSYSSRDRAALNPLLSALRRAHEEIWFDEELGAGEVWWHTILENIRNCRVFIFAMTTNSLDSKPCLAELRYAQQLGKPILPIQIGPISSMRVTPLAQVEAIDFQTPTVDSAIQLTTAVREAQERAQPLPSPLPEEPPVPFAYLMRLATTITGPDLDPRQQTSLLSELRTGLEEDGDDEAARRDIIELLCALRDRPDVTYRTRTDVDAVLATLPETSRTAMSPVTQAKTIPAPAAAWGPQSGPIPAYQPAPVPQRPYAPPVAQRRRSRVLPWVIAGMVALLLAGVGIVIGLLATRDSGSPPAASPTSLPPVSGRPTGSPAETSAAQALPPIVHGPDNSAGHERCDAGYSLPNSTKWGSRAGRGTPETSCFFANSVLHSYWSQFGE
ncbi:MAG TPA: TIR domain-containing protein, partial [Mycobacterium sp.]|nr:TIR domain-containing protein [Mycobacterium sp.]